MSLLWWLQAQIVWLLSQLPEDFFDVPWGGADDDD